MSDSSRDDLSPAQLDIYLNQQLHPGCPLYNVGGPMVVRAALDVDAFARAHADFVRRHDALNLRFGERDGVPIQYLAPAATDLPLIDLSAEPSPEHAAHAWSERLLATAFDLSDGHAHRAALLKLGPALYWYVACAHHIVLDGWSYALWAREVVARYEAIRAGVEPQAGAARDDEASAPRLLDLMAEEGRHADSRRYAATAAYWQAQFEQIPASPVPLRHGGAGIAPSVRHAVSWPRQDYARVEAFAASLGVAAHHVLLALTYAYFASVSGQDALVIGVPSHNRHRSALKTAIGSFATISPLRVTVERTASFASLIDSVKDALAAAARHPRYPLNRLGEALRARGQDVPRLFDLQFNYQRFDHEARIDGAAIESHHFGNGFEQVPAVVTVCDYGASHDIEWIVEVNTAHFDPRDAAAIMARLRTLLDDVMRRPEAALGDCVLLPEAERDQVLRAFNATDADHPDELLHEAFARRAGERPEAIAVACGDAEMSYGELEARANRLAHWLIERGVRPDQHVAVCLERSLDTPVALLAILKAGAAYVPLDPAYPQAHLGFTLRDSRAVQVLAHRALLPRLADTPAPVLCLDDADGLAILTGGDASPPWVDGLNPAHAAYVIYTSGSTGQPKGVCIEHRQAVAFIAWARSQFSREELGSVIAGTSLCFDLSVFELFVPLSAGTRVTLIRHPVDRDGLAAALAPTLLNTVPSAIAELLDTGAIPPSVRTINLAGEPLSRALVDRLYRDTGATAVYNLYGPSEDTTYSTVALMRADDRRAPSIGRPIGNGRAYVLDAAMRPLPVGVAGELYLGGAGVARGYLDRDELNAARFLADPFDPRPGARLYRTGDWARWRHDGELDFLGRLDHQVKVRGFRIELGEIESQLGALDQVAAAAAVVRESALGAAQLLAYVVPRGAVDEDDFVAACQSALRATLPEHMVPSQFVLLDAMPLTPNGKTDRKALPAPRAQSHREPVAPRDEREAALCALWGELLQRDSIGVHDTFFELGGDSLRALRMIARLRDRFGVELNLRDLFEGPTVAALAERIRSRAAAGPSAAAATTIARADRSAPLPASFAQQRLWFIDRFEGGSTHYHMSAALRLHGELEPAALAGAIAALVARHEALRTRLVEIDGELRQRIEAAGPVLLEIDLRHLTSEAGDAEAARVAAAHAAAPFDLSVDAPLRIALLRLADARQVLLFTLHHVCGDGASIAILLGELETLYRAELDAGPATLPALAAQYADYAAWQRETLDRGGFEPGLAYWSRQLEALPTVHNLPLDRAREARRGQEAGRVERRLPKSVAARLREACGRYGVTPFMYWHSALSVLLSRYSGQTDIVIGTPSEGRGRAELDGLIGLFVNTLALRSDLSAEPSFAALLAENKRRVLDAFRHQDVPFDLLVERLRPARTAAHAPLVQVLLTLPERDGDAAIAFAGVAMAPVPAASPTLKFDLELEVAESADGLRLRWDYASALWDEASIEAMADSLVCLLHASLDTPERAVSRLPILSPRARVAALGQDRAERAPAFDASTLPARFAAHARAHPDDLAVVCAEESCSYAALDAWSDRLAHALRARGVGAEQRVGLCLARSPALAAAVLAVLKAGAAYVPLDPAYPSDRLRHMIDDAALTWVLGDSASLERFERSGDADADNPSPARSLRLDEEGFARELAGYPGGPVAVAPEASDLAYIVYTSGSTGRPKGVCVEHRSLDNLGQAIAGLVASEHGHARVRWAWNASLSFDASLQAISQLGFGATVHLLPETLRQSPAELARFLDRQAIDVLDCTPSQLRLLLDETGTARLPMLLLGGEAVGASLWRRLVDLNERVGQVAYNVYGPSETCVDATACRIDATRREESLGEWLPNVHGYVLDPHGEPLPDGVAGELYIGGAGVARGYWRQPALTEQRFLADPFVADASVADPSVTGPRRENPLDADPSSPPARMYRTGDLVRRGRDGRLVYLGRNDEQIKLNGFRIELGEIEAQLLRQPGVLDAAVLASAQGENARGLVACLVASDRDGEAAAHDRLIEDCRRALAAALPAYMVPGAFVLVEAMPLTPAGKIDRKALAAQAGGIALRRAYAPPRGALETRLCAVWAEVLGLERVGRDDDFFELGGHSIAAIRLVARLRRDLGWETPLRALFEAPTVAALALASADFAAPADLGASVGPAAVPRDGSALPLSFAQQRFWFLEQLDGPSAAYNIAGGLSLRGELDAAALAASLAAIVERHEILRTAFLDEDGTPSQRVLDSIALDLTPVELSEPDLDAALREFAEQPFALAHPPLFRTRLLRVGADHHVLALNLHHAIADGWSLRVLTRELAEFYRAHAAADGGAVAAPLPALQVQYADYARWQRERMQGAQAERQLEYWRGQLGDAPELLNLPMRKARGQSRQKIGGQARAQVPAALAQALSQFANRQRTTVFVVLLAGFKALLARLSGQDDIVVGTPSVNRRETALEDMVGLFLDHLALRTRIESEPGFAALVARVHDTVMDAQAHAELPFERIVDAVVPNRDLSRHPLFQVFFNMVNLPPLRLDMPALAVEEVFVDGQDAKFDLTLYVHGSGDGLWLQSHYDADLFAAEQMDELLAQYLTLLQALIEAPSRPLNQASLLTDSARALLPDPAQPLDETWRGPVHAHFDRQVERDPGHLAVSDRRVDWSYLELQSRSRRLAARLRANGVGKGDVIAIYAARRAEIACALLATFRLGAAFVMLDPTYPAQRTRHYLDIARPRAWLQLTDGIEAGLVEELGESFASIAHRLDLDAIEAICADASAPMLDLDTAGLGPADLAYLAFTSGSTGLPKAVEGCQGSLTHFLPWLQERFGYGAHSRFSLLSGLAHDPLHRDVFTPLMIGASLCVPEPEDFAPRRLQGWMLDQRINVSHLTPSVSRILCDTDADARLPDLSCAFLTGELLTTHDMRQVARLAPNTLIVNFYGSTETQRAVSHHVISARELPEQGKDGQGEAGQGKAHIPLGRGIPDVQLVLLNGAGIQAGIGEAAEIFIRSPHLARGYWQDPELTAERFLRNGFTDRAGDMLYRTGDLGRYRPDGQVEALGRIDHQVKIRGFRIEPGEIEAQLSRHARVKACVVIAREFEAVGTALIAYVVPMPVDGEPAQAGPTQDELVSQWKAWLGEQLPAYMVPALFVTLDLLPLTPNGKIDRRALPAPGRDALQRAEHVAPRDDSERALCELWAELLGLERVGVHDNFFDLGGHSLLATRMVSQLRQRLGRELPLRALFEQPTVAELALRLAAGPAHPPVEQAPAPIAVDRSGVLPLSYAQQRLWFIDRLQGGSPEYNMPAAFRLDGALDEAAFQYALDTLLSRHEVLRTRIVEHDGIAHQQVQPAMPVSIARHDLSDLPADQREARLQALVQADARAPFDLGRGPMMRASLIRLDPSRHVALFNQHHIASDGWSLGVLIDEFAALYAAGVEGAGDPLPPLPLQYGDYASWQRQWLVGPQRERELGYWRERLAELPPLHSLPLDRPRPPLRSANGRRLRQQFDADMANGLRAVARGHDATLFMLLQTAFALLLSRHSAQHDIVMGTPIAGRDHAEFEGLIGFFVNTLVLRTQVQGEAGFAELLARNKQHILDAYAHQRLPFEQLVDELKPVRELSHNALVQIWFHLQNYRQDRLQLPGLSLTPIEEELATCRFELELHALEGDDGLSLSWVYNTDLFDASTIERLSANFAVLLQGLLDEHDGHNRSAVPARSVAKLPLLSASERQTLADWNRTELDFDRGHCVHALFEARARATPEAVALVFESRQWRYAELNAWANRVAHRLIAEGVGPDSLVGLCMERSPDMVVGLLAVLKAGGAYVPLDPGLPPARLRSLIDDSGMAWVLTQSALHALWAEGLPAAVSALVLDDEASVAALSLLDDRDPQVAGLGPRHLAYMIYTSGSTGQPKGVLVEHEALVNRLDWMQREYGLRADDRVLQKTPYSFDVSVWEFLWPLVQGACLVLARPDGHKDPHYLCQIIREHAITTLHFVPSMLNALLSAADWSSCDSVRRVFCSGEALGRDLVAAFFATGTAAQLHNLYGPTEAAIDVSYWDCADWSGRSQIPIGRPIQNIALHVLNEAGEPQPIGAPGELHIGGIGLARGYLNRPQLTAEKFVHSQALGSRVYRTGDLARWLADGTIEYLGRNDFQVKVRGLRIELGEIEAKLLACEGVREAVVVARQDGAYEQRLVAYVVAEAGVELSAQELRLSLARELADYMLPSAFVSLPALPLSSNGKLDRKALPAPDASVLARPAFEAPMGETERVLAAIWTDLLGTELLGIEAIGRHDHFFELGGHSLSLMQVHGRIRERFRVEIGLRDLFARPLLSAQAELISTLQLEAFLGDDMDAMSDELDGLSEQELLELLKRESVND